ncbi:MAG: hypothetical protein IEMM0002_0264 [bacterium]|nr:MAG: hypothetical protein IEMM0002_0264 [bacterium]
MIGRAVLAAAYASVFFTGVAFASSAHIVNIAVKENYSMLTASVNLEGAFTEEIKEAFKSGMPVTFTFLVNVVRSRPFFWDAGEKSIRLHKIVKYDSFAKEYNAIDVIAPQPPAPGDFEKLLESIKKDNGDTLFSEQPAKPGLLKRRHLVLKDLSTVEYWMSRLRGIPLGNTVDYPADKKYYLQVKAEMDTIKLTPPFNYIFFFVSFLNFDTDWETSSPFIIKQYNPPINNMVVLQDK